MRNGPSLVQLSLIHISQGQADIDIPTIQAYVPAEGKATGAAMVVFPGGGYKNLSMVNEGSKIGQWLADNGITAFVVKYRLGMKLSLIHI